MFAVLFEVEPRPERWDDYMHHATALRPELLAIDGFIDNRRFRSTRRPGVLLSLSYWRDEKALIRWRTRAPHHLAQVAGRNEIFRDYRLRVGEVTHNNDTPCPRSRLDETATGAARAVTLIEMPDGPPASLPGLLDWDLFDGVTVPGSAVLLLSWPDAAVMRRAAPQPGARRVDIAILRDYGLHGRDEAPQYHPPVSA